MKTLLMVSILLAVTLAGCSDGTDKPKPGDDDDKFGELKTDKDKGIIRGLVLDPSITPIAGATVSIRSLGVEQQSNADGAFVFKDLEPGTYFLEVTKLGYALSQTSTSVAAGDAAPPIVKVQLLRDVANQPFTEVTQYRGYLQCGVGVPGVPGVVGGSSANPCAATDSINTFEVFVQRPVTFAQSELFWEGTNELGDGFNFGHYDPNTDFSNYAEVDGPSPQILRVNGTIMEEKNGPGYGSFVLRVFPGSTQPSLVLEQEFEIIHTNFYRFVPDEDWTFLADGAHPMPF